jgi:hypothetical protein
MSSRMTERLSAWAASQPAPAPPHDPILDLPASIESRRTDFAYHPDCTLCCQSGRCHWCMRGAAGRVSYDSGGAVIQGGAPTTHETIGEYTYWMCANHIRYFRTVSRGRSIDPLAGTGFDPNSPFDRHNLAQGLSPLLHIPTQKQREQEP